MQGTRPCYRLHCGPHRGQGTQRVWGQAQPCGLLGEPTPALTPGWVFVPSSAPYRPREPVTSLCQPSLQRGVSRCVPSAWLSSQTLCWLGDAAIHLAAAAAPQTARAPTLQDRLHRGMWDCLHCCVSWRLSPHPCPSAELLAGCCPPSSNHAVPTTSMFRHHWLGDLWSQGMGLVPQESSCRHRVGGERGSAEHCCRGDSPLCMFLLQHFHGCSVLRDVGYSTQGVTITSIRASSDFASPPRPSV